MPIVVGVVFKRAGKVYYFDPDGIDLKSGEKVVVKTSRGMEFGEVVSSPTEVPDEEIIALLKKVVRRASDDDKSQLTKNKQKEKEAFRVAEEKIAKHRLPMKLIEVEYVFDGSKIIFYFTSDGRVDFRELVKDLASVFRTRIELRQIGVRDEAKMVGGLGPCGQRLCCTVFLGDFEPVSIRMAKEQDLPLNPLKISGICGRLMCCLKYEYEAYQDFKKRAPRRGTRLTTEFGTARIVEFNVPKETVIAELESGQRIEMPLADALGCKCKAPCKPDSCCGNGGKPKIELEDSVDIPEDRGADEKGVVEDRGIIEDKGIVGDVGFAEDDEVNEVNEVVGDEAVVADGDVVGDEEALEDEEVIVDAGGNGDKPKVDEIDDGIPSKNGDSD
ncbi:MAG: stage 0 sporulation protein [Candidatus Aquicultor secundus]|uniref:Stage 0 sporulation protein n=1 Tax=Candidatus Aquicultor secundus TaxID=1973895 RepID=A0A2M7T8X9_9ACTN|nr:stage 0 sporulation family protein [Candidatus Aquicultor secundus]NCO66546.1 stage 0 sporulation family protein [Solirubrobacter sp.]OIO88172.1 MAG: hypothetical protein AUK32_02150 [Candidatus Aquicultor secundus]PIU25971.1 MAG: stage 0 sporulation protein [Candidatus Aquicultor secundus]PIW22492.1 MAG: stage 0 sporulation protein [Candidatus Aquicultor secundus]PIX51701.1 MAG: stage 0 sporulation protein [Candidatus Aquicultor secundus]